MTREFTLESGLRQILSSGDLESGCGASYCEIASGLGAEEKTWRGRFWKSRGSSGEAMCREGYGRYLEGGCTGEKWRVAG